MAKKKRSLASRLGFKRRTGDELRGGKEQDTKGRNIRVQGSCVQTRSGKGWKDIKCHKSEALAMSHLIAIIKRADEDDIRAEIRKAVDSLRDDLVEALFVDDDSVTPAELVKSVVEQAMDSLKEQAESWTEGEPVVKRDVVEQLTTIAKFDEAQQLVFGILNVSVNKAGDEMVDLQGDIITPDVLEKAAYEYVMESGKGGIMHKGEPVATLVESMVFTPEKLELLGLPRDAIPPRWWGGYKIHDPEVFEEMRSGSHPMFSIQGSAERVEV